MQLTISGYSTAMFATWYFVEELGILFDAGDGLSAGLLQKAGKINHVFISHADRDHLTGLLQFNQLNARKDFPVIYYPQHCGSFAALQNFSQKFDPHVAQTKWQEVIDKEKIYLRNDLYVQAIRNNHVNAPQNVHKSLGYKIVSVKQKLRPEFGLLSPTEIKNRVAKEGKHTLMMNVESTILAYSGDTPVENFEHWNGAGVLIHESTFLGGAEDKTIKTHGNKHSNLKDVIKAVSEINLGKLILGHFSSRYADDVIDAEIKKYCLEFGVKFPVYRVLPGQTVKNILAGEPLIN